MVYSPITMEEYYFYMIIEGLLSYYILYFYRQDPYKAKTWFVCLISRAQLLTSQKDGSAIPKPQILPLQILLSERPFMNAFRILFNIEVSNNNNFSSPWWFLVFTHNIKAYVYL